MSLIGHRTAVIALGPSCQVAYQLSENRERLSAILRDDLAYQSSFFNWIFTSTEAISNLIRRLSSESLTDASITVPEDYHASCGIEDLRVWLWHEKPSHEITPELRNQIASKYEHLRQNFLNLASKPRRYFVIANTQSNVLTHYPFLSGEMKFDLRSGTVDHIKRTLDEVFPTGSNRLLVFRQGEHMKAFTEGWQGDSQAWERALTRALPIENAYARIRRSLRPLRAAVVAYKAAPRTASKE